MKSHKEEKPALRGKWEKDTCSRGDSCSFSHTKHNRPLLLERRRHRLTEENRQKVLAPGDEVFLEGKSRKRAYISSMESVRIRRVIIGMLLCVKITSVNRDATMATIVN